MTDKNLNNGDGSPESENLASKKAKDAQAMLRTKIGDETKAALSKKDEAAHFAEENLSTTDQAGKFVEKIWEQIRQNPAFRDVVMSDEDIAPLAASIRTDFLKKLTMMERSRSVILEQISTEYDLDVDQFDALQESIGAIRSEDLDSYRTPSYRNLFLSRFFLKRNEPIPFIRKIADRFRKIIGSDWDTLDIQSKSALVSAEKSHSMSNASLNRIWSRLSDGSRVELVSFLTLNLTFASLNELDDYVFSKKKLVQASRRSIEAHLSPKNRELMGKMEGLKLEDILSELEWADIQSMKVSRDVILELMQNAEGYVLPKKFSGVLQNWFDEHLEMRMAEQERKAKEAGEAASRNPSDVPPISEEWARGLSQKLLEKNNSTIEGEELFTNPAFLNGTEKLVYQVSPSWKNSETEYFVIDVDESIRDHDGKTRGFFAIPLDSSGKKLSEIARYVPSSAFHLSAVKTSHFLVQRESDFYKWLSREVPKGIADISDVDFTPVNLDPVPKGEEMQFQLDLAAGYIDMELPEDARELLEEVIAKGTPEQAEQARGLLETLPVTPVEIGESLHADTDEAMEDGNTTAPSDTEADIQAESEAEATADSTGGGSGNGEPPAPNIAGADGEEERNVPPADGGDWDEPPLPPGGLPPSPPSGGGNVPPTPPNAPNSAEAEDDGLPNTLDAFHDALSKNFNNSAKLEVGGCISIGKPGTTRYFVYRILALDANTLTLWGGAGSFPAEVVDYSTLYGNYVQKELKHFKILPNKLSDAATFLSTMQSESSQKDAWRDLEISKDDDGNEIFDFMDRRFDTHKVKKQYFPGMDGSIMEITSIENGMAQVRIGEDFKKAAKNDKNEDIGPTADWGEPKEYPLQYVIQYLIRNACAPWNSPPREISSRAVPEKATKTTAGILKAAFGRLSIHDIIAGSKKFKEEFLHHLQHGNHLQEQRVMLMIAKKTGMESWNNEWYADFKSQYENGEKKLIEERLETLGKMGTPDRQKSIRASLFNNGTHDYDHWTNALCMVEKHGHLYAGELRDLEGSWIFFKRIAGIPLGDNVNDYKEFQTMVSTIRKKGIDNVTEEAVIEEYMKIHPTFPNAQIWRMLKKKVAEGNENEQKSGGDEAEQFINLEQRLNYAMGKIESREYAHAIGALEKIFEKEGSAHKKQALAFMLAMSRIPERLPRKVLDRFVKIYDEGRLHSPALTFIKDRQSQEKFRDTVKAIVKVKTEQRAAAGLSPSSMQEDFNNMMKSVGENVDVMNKHVKGGASSEFATDSSFSRVKNFWEKYGREIQNELTGNPRGTVLISQRALDANPILAEYKANIKKQLGDTNLHHPTELDRGTPFMDGEEGAGVISFRPDKIIDKMGLQTHHGGFSGSNLDRGVQADFRASMEEIRDKDAEIMDKADKRAWFKDVYVEYIKKITATSNLSNFLDQPTVKPFNDLGLEPPTEVDQVELQREVNRIKKLLKDEQGKIEDKKSDLEIIQNEIQSEKEIIKTKEAELKKIQDAIPAWTAPTSEQKKSIDKINEEIAEWNQKSEWFQQKIKPLNKEIVEWNMKCAEFQKQIHAVETNKDKYVALIEGDSLHMVHFEAMFEKFLRSGQTSGSVRNSTRNRTADTLGTGESPISTGGEQTDGSGNS